MAAKKPIPYPDELAYLQDEMRWIEARCRRIHAAKRLDNVEDDVPTRHREAAHPSDLMKTMAQQKREEERLRTEIDARRAVSMPSALDSLCDLHGLDAFDRMLVLLASAPVFSQKFEDLYGAMSRASFHATRLTVEIAFQFAELSFAERITHRARFSKRAPLFANDVLVFEVLGRMTSPEELLTSDVTLASRTFAYLVGDPTLSNELIDFSTIEEPLADLDQVVLDRRDKQRILSVVERHETYLRCRREWGFDDVIRYGRGVLMLFHGVPGTGKTMTAHAVAKHLGKRVLNVDIPTFLEHQKGDHLLPSLFREARLQGAVLFFDECETLFASRRRGNILLNVLLTEIERFEGVAILATNAPEELDAALDRRVLVKVAFAEPDRDARLAIWRKHLPAAAPLAEDVDIDALASRYEMTGGYIKNAVLAAVAEAVHSGGDAPRITMAHLDAAARDQLRRPSLDGRVLVTPKVRLTDVCLPDAQAAQVAEIVDAARNRRLVLERWGIGAHLSYGKGVSALFYGPPGTGKTLCAEAIAGELNRPLLAASIASTTSMWVGQTEKNIERLFGEAQASGAVLFLDEADALLAARGSGRASRHDDAAVDVLLVNLERFDGVVLLATNLPDRLDPALARRIGWRLEFPFPDARTRTAIWRRMLPPSVPLDGEIDVEALGAAHRLSGGQIKNAVLRAAFRAARGSGRLGQRDLDRAANEEGTGAQERPVGFAAK